MQNLKVVVVGDGGVGKTSLLMSLNGHPPPYEWMPTVFDTNPIAMIVDGIPIQLSCWDTAGQDDYDR